MRNQPTLHDFNLEELCAMSCVLINVSDWADVVREITFGACRHVVSDPDRYGRLLMVAVTGTYRFEKHPLVEAVLAPLAAFPRERQLAILDYLLTGRSLVMTSCSLQPQTEAVL